MVHNTLGPILQNPHSYPYLVNHTALDVAFNESLAQYYLSTWEFYPVPQIKARMFESALAGALIVVWRDHHRLIERFFALDEFVYFDNEADFQRSCERWHRLRV